MQASVEDQLREILEAFKQFGLRTVDDISQLVSSVSIYVEILKLLIPEYEEFYRQLLSDSQSTLQQKLQAIVHFLQSQIIEQQIDIQTHLIAQGDYTEALQLLDVLYSLLEGLLQAEKEQTHKKQVKKQQKSSKKPAEAQRSAAVTKEQTKKQTKLIERNPQKSQKQKPQSASARPKPKEVQKQMPDITTAVINEIKQARKSAPKAKNINFQDKDSTEAVLKVGRQYQHHLKEHLRQRKHLSKVPTQDSIKKNLRYTLNRLGKQASQSQSKIKAEQLRCFIELRDEKLRYVQRIHKLILQLEKQKHLDQKQQNKKIMEQQLRQAKFKMQSLDNAYHDKMTMIKNTMKETRLKNQEQRLKQKQIVTQLSKQLKQQRNNQYQNMMTEWQKEQDRLKMMFRTDEKLEKALISLYKKN